MAADRTGLGPRSEYLDRRQRIDSARSRAALQRSLTAGQRADDAPPAWHWLEDRAAAYERHAAALFGHKRTFTGGPW